MIPVFLLIYTGTFSDKTVLKIKCAGTFTGISRFEDLVPVRSSSLDGIQPFPWRGTAGRMEQLIPSRPAEGTPIPQREAPHNPGDGKTGQRKKAGSILV